MKTLLDGLFTYDCEIDGECTYTIVCEVTFQRDFGPWKNGQKVDEIGIDWERCTLYECKEEGGRSQETKFAITAAGPA